MKFLIILCILLLILTNLFINSKEAKLSQKKGIWQDTPEKQINFTKYEKIQFDFNKVPLKHIMKISLYKNKIFILDFKRKMIFVIDKKGNFLYTIGRPGQGPEEIEDGRDFFITPDEKIYVLNSMPNRIEVFDIRGKPIKSIKITSASIFSRPKSILVDKNKNLILSNDFSREVVTVHGPDGVYKKTILDRNSLEAYNEVNPNLGIPAKLAFLDDKILHFDLFRGIFTEVTFSGTLLCSYSANSETLNKRIIKVEAKYKGNKKKTIMGGHSTFAQWESFCIDKYNRIYSFPLVLEDGYQYMYVFGEDGNYLYKKPLDYFKAKHMPVKNICCDRGCFVFGTYNLDLIITYIGGIP